MMFGRGPHRVVSPLPAASDVGGASVTVTPTVSVPAQRMDARRATGVAGSTFKQGLVDSLEERVDRARYRPARPVVARDDDDGTAVAHVAPDVASKRAS